MKKNLIISLFIPLVASAANSLVPIEVTSERISKSLDKVSSSVVVFSAQDIENSNAQTIKGLLKKVPGIHVRENSDFGKITGFYIRGANTSYTKVIIDGIKVNDPTTSEGEFDFSSFSLENIERIEIIKGSQGVLYGPDAVAGVLKITTKKGSSKTRSSVRAGLGSYDNKMLNASFASSISLLSFSFGMDTQKVEGISSFNEKRGTNTDVDGHKHINANLNLSLDLKNAGEISAYIKRNDAESEFDGFGVDELGAHNETTHSLYSLNYQNTFLEKKLDSSFSIGRYEVKRDSFGALPGTYDGESHTLENQNIYNISSNDDIFFGLRYEHNEMLSTTFSDKNKKSNEAKGIFLGNYFTSGDFFSDQGISFDDFGHFGDEVTYRLGAGHKFKTNTILKSSYATGFKAPVLDQLYATYGNEKLQAFESNNYEIAISQKYNNFDFQVTYFKTKIENEIAYDLSKSSYSNIAETKLYGWEFSFAATAFEMLRAEIGADLIRTQKTVGSNAGAYLSERPRKKYTAQFELFLSDNVTLNMDHHYVGEKSDSTGKLSSYYLIDLAGSYNINDSLNLAVHINNVLDKDYEQVRTYGTLGREFKFFVKWKL